MNDRLKLSSCASAFMALTIYLYKTRRSRFPMDKVIYRGGDFPSFIRTISPDVFEAHTDWGLWGLNSDAAPRHLLMTDEQCERVLMENVQRHDVGFAPPFVSAPSEEETAGKGANRSEGQGRVVRWEVNEVASNKPNEDAWAVDFIHRDLLRKMLDKEKKVWTIWSDIKQALGDQAVPRKTEVRQSGAEDDRLMMFTMIDGHGGHSVAQVIKKTLHIKLAQHLAMIPQGSSFNEDQVMQMIKDAFVRLDEEILAAPLTLLKQPAENPEANQSLALTQLLPLELAGACVTTAIVDESSNKLYVANIGDCRAVAGWFDPKTGLWTCDVLSDIGDQDYDNPMEEKRLREAHAEDDQSTLLTAPGKGLRLFGVQDVSRAMGDAHGKRTVEDTKSMSDHLGITYLSKGKPYISPPYLSNEPEVVVREISPDTGAQLRFIILATDGLWGFMSSEEAALLVAAAIDSETPRTVSKSDLPHQHLFAQNPHRPYPTDDLPGSGGWKSKGSWTFQDDNLALHLTRNALGRGDAWERRRLLSMKDNGHRLFRDDITVSVVRFG